MYVQVFSELLLARIATKNKQGCWQRNKATTRTKLHSAQTAVKTVTASLEGTRNRHMTSDDPQCLGWTTVQPSPCWRTDQRSHASPTEQPKSLGDTGQSPQHCSHYLQNRNELGFSDTLATNLRCRFLPYFRNCYL